MKLFVCLLLVFSSAALAEPGSKGSTEAFVVELATYSKKSLHRLNARAQAYRILDEILPLKDINQNRMGYNPTALQKIINHSSVNQAKLGRKRIVQVLTRYLQSNPPNDKILQNTSLHFLIGSLLYLEVRQERIEFQNNKNNTDTKKLHEYFSAEKLAQNMMVILAGEIIEKQDNAQLEKILVDFKEGSINLERARNLIRESTSEANILSLQAMMNALKYSKNIYSTDIFSLYHSPSTLIDLALKERHTRYSNFIDSSGLHYSYSLLTASVQRCKAMFQ
tara:strand:+ start:1516 stop:2352 length:837 start_codon:yes stop_codon:yes gene_type:complete